MQTGDVRSLPFADNSFDGYWSLGVIEHFPEGYDKIASEMLRVLKPGAFLFLTFPSFNGLRKARAASGKYLEYTGKLKNNSNFYQFAFDPKIIIKNFSSIGFSFIEHRGLASLGGLAEESVFGTILEKIIKKVHPRLESVVSMVLDATFGGVS